MALFYLRQSWHIAVKSSRNFPVDKRIFILWAEFGTIVLNGVALFLFTTIVLWWPYISSVREVYRVIQRIFPFNRGIFEDKVATFWCMLSTVIKIRDIVPT
jgi:alpha-1,3-glucosyltransferase